MRPVVFLDANVLVPYNLASLLLTMADHGLIEVRWSRWSTKVLEEATANLQDFPLEEMYRVGIELTHPEQLLLTLMRDDVDSCREAVEAEAARRTNPSMSQKEFLATLTPFAPTFANTLHQWGSSRPSTATQPHL